MTKKWIADCSRFPSENNCDIMISGTKKDEVAKAAMYHAIVAQNRDGCELGLYESIKSTLEQKSAGGERKNF